MINIVLFGPPGAGKGTQAFKLKEHFGLVHISTGDLLRSEMENHSVLGLKAKELIDQGKLVPDKVVNGMIEKQLESNPDARGFIFDGFPRTIVQARELDRLLMEYDTSISLMLSLEVDRDELLRRLLLRGKDSGRADDQNQRIISSRIREYHEKTMPVIKYYTDQNKYRAVSGQGAIEDIFGELVSEIERIS